MSYLPKDDSRKIVMNLGTTVDEYSRLEDLEARRLYLYGSICSLDEHSGMLGDKSISMHIVEQIMRYNREDDASGLPPEQRQPIKLYINSPGGDQAEGWSIISAIKLSKTPVWTINVGMWASMAFLIGITGNRRISMPDMTFLMHDGISVVGDSTQKALDKAKFDERFEKEVSRRHILQCSSISAKAYNKHLREEYYMLPKDALRHGFIDRIAEDISEIF